MSLILSRLGQEAVERAQQPFDAEVILGVVQTLLASRRPNRHRRTQKTNATTDEASRNNDTVFDHLTTGCNQKLDGLIYL